MKLDLDPGLPLPVALQAIKDRVILDVGTKDVMYKGKDAHYLSVGASALNIILAALAASCSPSPSSILDFGCGKGRVLRWIRAAFPDAALHACDLGEDDVQYCRETYGANGWMSSPDIGNLDSPARYDLIWAGSVITHLSSDKTKALLDKFLSWTKPGGLVVASFHGRYTLGPLTKKGFYLQPDGWDSIARGVWESGYGYSDYAAKKGYGVSACRMSWLIRHIETRKDMQLVLLSEKAWDDHHDVIAVKAVDDTAGFTAWG